MFKCLHKDFALQDADQESDLGGCGKGGLGHFNRSKERLFPCAHLPRPQTFSPLCHPGAGLPVQGPPIWPFPLTKGVWVTHTFLRALRPWRDARLLLQGVPLGNIPSRRTEVSTDASLTGWGAVWEHRMVRGIWEPPCGEDHINVLELALLPSIQGRHDALSHEWPDGLLYAFPPLPLISQVLHGVTMGRYKVLLIAPRGPKKLLRLVHGQPWALPGRVDLLSQAGGLIWVFGVSVH